MNKCEEQNILFLINVDAYFKQLFPIVLHLKQNTDFNPILYFPLNYPSIEKHLKQCDENNIYYISSYKENDNINVLSNNKLDYKKYLKKIKPLNKILIITKTVLGRLKYFIREKNIAKNIINKYKCKLLVLGGDNIGHNTDIFIKVFKAYGLKSIIFAGWMASPLEAYEANKYNKRLHINANLLNKLFAKINNNLVYGDDDYKILRWSVYEYILKHIFGTIPTKPWVLHSGDADLIIAESVAMRNYMIKEGLNSIKIDIAGTIHHDSMSKIIKNKNKALDELYEKYILNKNLKICLVALPPDLLYGYGRPECEFKDYIELVEIFLGEIVKLNSYNIIVSIHPSSSNKELSEVSFLNDVVITEKDITELIPLCDIFIASVSSTIQWAICCSKPVINYDVYKYKYTDYNDVKGVIYTDNKIGYKEILNKFQEEEFYERISTLQYEEAKNWGKLDGKSIDRILDILNKKVL